MAAQRIDFGRQDAGAAAGCGCHGAHTANTAAASGPDEATTTDVVTELAVDGMTCDHCVRAVTSELRTVTGVEGVEIDLVAGGTSRVRVHSGIPLDSAALAAAIDEAGYALHA